MVRDTFNEETHRRLNWIAVLIFFSLSAAFSPTFSLYAKHLHRTPFETGFLFAIPGLLGMLFRVPAGTLAALLGRRTILALGALACIFSPLILIKIPTEQGLLFGVIGYGFAHFFAPVAISWIHDIAPDRDRAKFLGFFSMRNAAGRAMGPLVAGYLIDRTQSFTTVYLCCSASALLALILIFSLREPNLSTPRTLSIADEFRHDLKSCFSERMLFYGVMIRAVHGLLSGVFHTYFPWYATEVAHLDATQIGFIQASLIGSALLMRGISGVVMQRPKSINFVAWLNGWTLIACGFVFLVPQFVQFVPLLLISMGLGVSEGFVYLLTLLHASQVVEKRFFATAIGMFGTGTDAGLMTGRFLPGWIIASVPAGLAYPVGFGFAAVGGMLIVFVMPLLMKRPIVLSEANQ